MGSVAVFVVSLAGFVVLSIYFGISEAQPYFSKSKAVYTKDVSQVSVDSFSPKEKKLTQYQGVVQDFISADKIYLVQSSNSNKGNILYRDSIEDSMPGFSELNVLEKIEAKDRPQVAKQRIISEEKVKITKGFDKFENNSNYLVFLKGSNGQYNLSGDDHSIFIVDHNNFVYFQGRPITGLNNGRIQVKIRVPEVIEEKVYDEISGKYITVSSYSTPRRDHINRENDTPLTYKQFVDLLGKTGE